MYYLWLQYKFKYTDFKDNLICSIKPKATLLQRLCCEPLKNVGHSSCGEYITCLKGLCLFANFQLIVKKLQNLA